MLLPRHVQVVTVMNFVRGGGAIQDTDVDIFISHMYCFFQTLTSGIDVCHDSLTMHKYIVQVTV